MKFVRTVTTIEPASPKGKTIVYMVGYGGRTWQAKRHLNVLSSEGYRLLVMDFVDILRRKDPQDLVDLMNEVEVVLKKQQVVSKDTLIVGVSLGGLVGFNMIKRFSALNKLLVITGGNMTHIPSGRCLKKGWNLTRDELARHWADVNIYTPPGSLQGKHIVMLLPKRDRVIDPSEVADEIAQLSQCNEVTLKPANGGHFRTIITETVLFPRRSLQHIRRLERF